jgi:hypothetical protein
MLAGFWLVFALLFDMSGPWVTHTSRVGLLTLHLLSCKASGRFIYVSSVRESLEWRNYVEFLPPFRAMRPSACGPCTPPSAYTPGRGEQGGCYSGRCVEGPMPFTFVVIFMFLILHIAPRCSGGCSCARACDCN